jgi:hypothetical protein
MGPGFQAVNDENLLLTTLGLGALSGHALPFRLPTSLE